VGLRKLPFVHVGCNRAGLQNVLTRTKVASRAFAVAYHCGLGGGIVGQSGKTGPRRKARLDCDDPAAFRHDLGGRSEWPQPTRCAVDGIEPIEKAKSLAGLSTAPPADTPALLTRISKRPKSSATAVTRPATGPASAWSALKAAARTPALCRSRTTSAAFPAEAT
jgi:hypothetical protein